MLGTQQRSSTSCCSEVRRVLGCSVTKGEVYSRFGWLVMPAIASAASTALSMDSRAATHGQGCEADAVLMNAADRGYLS